MGSYLIQRSGVSMTNEHEAAHWFCVKLGRFQLSNDCRWNQWWLTDLLRCTGGIGEGTTSVVPI